MDQLVRSIVLFGSNTHDTTNKNSDIDILVSFKKPLGWDFFDLQDLLEDELNLKVDLVSEKALKKQLKHIILKSVKYV